MNAILGMQIFKTFEKLALSQSHYVEIVFGKCNTFANLKFKIDVD